MLGPRPICLLLCALGGEGGGVLSDWLIATARRAGFAAQKTSVPGVAQRTGATTYYVEVFPIPIAQLNGRKPVLSLYPVPGMVDALISSELLEAVRQTTLGMADTRFTTIVSSSSRALTTIERMQMGDGRLDSAKLVDVLRANSRDLRLLDMAAIAQETGTVVSAVMLGAVAGCGVLPFSRADFEAVLCAGGQAAGANRDGFLKAYHQVADGRIPDVTRQAAAADAASAKRVVPEAISSRFPAPLHPVLALGYGRVLDYQDLAYANLYVQRVERVLQSERAHKPEATQSYAATREAARWLALWMTFEDIARVAALKLRVGRRARVRQEVHAAQRDVVRIYDYFRPGVSELADVLPPPLARFVLRRDSLRRQKGLASPSLPLVLGTHTVTGTLALRVLASLRHFRRHGHRYRSEQALIERWLDGVCTLLRQDWQCGYEMAQCARLIKGYGSTNERAKGNLVHLLTYLVPLKDSGAAPAHAQAIAQARQAALDDEAGKKLDEVLLSHGVPVRSPKTVPIRFVKRARARAPSP